MGIICPMTRSRYAPCHTCNESPEEIAVHTGFLSLFMQESKNAASASTEFLREALLDFLWIRSCWKSPWRCSPYRSLEDKPPAVSPDASMAALSLLNFKKLPTEMVHRIQMHSPESKLWDYPNIVQIARRSAVSIGASELVAVPVWRVLSWERGHQPVLSKQPCRLVRLTIDSHGIKSVERIALDSSDQCLGGGSNDRSDRLAYAIFDNHHMKATRSSRLPNSRQIFKATGAVLTHSPSMASRV